MTVPRNRAGNSTVLLESLIAMQFVPEQREEKRHDETDHGCEDDEGGGRRRLKGRITKTG